MADPDQNQRSRRHPNLRLPRRDPLTAGNYAAGEDRHLTGQALRGSELARLRKNLISSRATAVYFRKIFLIPKPRRQVGAGRVPISTSESRMKLSPIIRSSTSI